MAIKQRGKKIVNDILGFNHEGIYIIELKSDRKLTKLIEQVEIFECVINEQKSFFSDLLSIYGCQWDNKSIQKAILWPSQKKPRNSTSQDIQDKHIIEFTYDEDEMVSGGYKILRNL
ncbi:MAG: hypothetical protein O6943_11250 [Bacteroidetes bacterium]|nr:hypothetical protein [Bacteroidota bacterium]